MGKLRSDEHIKLKGTVTLRTAPFNFDLWSAQSTAAFLFKLKCAGVKFSVNAFFCDELFMAAALDNSAVVKNHDNIRVLNG